MDCQTARNLLDLGRNCGPDDRAALDVHLDGCGGCQGFAAAQAGFDAAVSLAMNAVVVPAGAAERAARLAVARRAVLLRRQWVRGFGAVSAALVAGLVGYGAYLRTRPTVDATEMALQFDLRRDDPERFAADWLTANGLPPALPHRFDPRLLIDAGWSDLPGRPTPCLLYGKDGHTLRVFVLARTQFRLTDIQPSQGSFATVTPVPESPAHPGVQYLLVYTSPTLDPFLVR